MDKTRQKLCLTGTAGGQGGRNFKKMLENVRPGLNYGGN